MDVDVCQQGSLNCTELNSEIKVTVVRWREKRERESDREGGKKEKRYGSQTSMECVGERKRNRYDSENLCRSGKEREKERRKERKNHKAWQVASVTSREPLFTPTLRGQRSEHLLPMEGDFGQRERVMQPGGGSPWRTGAIAQ